MNLPSFYRLAATRGAIRPRRPGGGPRADCKPGSVPLGHPGGGDHLSGTPVSRRLKRPLPEGSASNLRSDRTGRPGRGSPSYLVLLRAGFTWPAGHPTAGGLLPHHFTLAGSRRRCHFCGTFLRVTPTGRYPAPCSSEPGLSSPPHNRGGAVTRPPRPKAILPRPELQQTASSMALLARASAPRFRSLGTWRTVTRGNECNNPVAWRWSGASSLSRTL